MDENPNYLGRESTNGGHSWKCAHSKPRHITFLGYLSFIIAYANFE